MNKKNWIIVALGIVILAGGWFGYSFYNKQWYKNHIPDMPELTGMSEKLKTQIVEANQKAQKDVSSESIGELGMVYFSSDYYNEAIESFDLAAKRDGNRWEWLYYIGYLQSELGDAEKAAEYFKKVTSINSDVHLAWYRLAEVYQQTGKPELAEEILLNLLSRKAKEFVIKPKNRLTYFELPLYARNLLARVYMDMKKYDKAEEQFFKVINERKDFGQAYKQLGIMYKRIGQEEKADKYTTRSKDLVVFNFPVDTLLDNVTLISRSTGFVMKQIDVAIRGIDYRWTVEVINTALKNLDQDKYLVDKAVGQYLHMGLGRHALPFLDKHFEAFYDSWKDLEQMGVRLADAGYKKEALKYFNRVDEIDVDDIEKKVVIAGMFFEKLGEKQKAIDMMVNILNKEPNDEKTIEDAVFLFLISNEESLTDKYLAKLKSINPNNKRILLYKGIQAEFKGDINKAKDLYEKSFERNSDKEYLVQRLGSIYEKDKEWDKAIRFYKRAIDFFPNNSFLQERLGALLISSPEENLRNIEMGIEFAERAFYNCTYTNNSKVSAARSLAIAYHQLNNPGLSDYYINQAIDIASKARFDANYIRGLVSLSEQFRQ